MTITSKIRLSLDRRGAEEVIDAVQGDENSRYVEIVLIQNGAPWNVPDGSTAQIGYKREDGSGSVYDTLDDGTQAYNYQGNVLTIALAPQVLVAPGKVGVTVCIIQDGVKLNTFSICVNVQPNNGLQNNGKDAYKLAGTLADRGWKPNYVLGTDANGFVVVKELWGNAITSSQITEDADGTLTMVNTLMDGIETIVVTPDENGNIRSINYNGKEIPISWAVSG